MAIAAMTEEQPGRQQCSMLRTKAGTSAKQDNTQEENMSCREKRRRNKIGEVKYALIRLIHYLIHFLRK